MLEPHHLSGRAVAVTLPSVAPGTPALSPLPAEHSDAELLALREPYERTLAGIAAAGKAASALEEASAATHRACPERDLVEIQREVGLDVAEARFDVAVDDNIEVIDQIVKMPARTLEGLIFKGKVAKQETYIDAVAASVIDDLVTMAGGAQAETALLSRRSLAAATPSLAAASVSDPVFARIEEHRVLRQAIALTSGADDDPIYKEACEAENRRCRPSAISTRLPSRALRPF